MNARLTGKLARLPRPTLDSVLRRAHLSVSLIAVLAAGLTLTAVALLALRVYSDQNLRLVARSMSYTVEAAVVFGDPMAAKEALALIGVNEDIDQAQVSGRDGKVLARWERGEHGTRYVIERALTGWMLPDSLTFPIAHDEQVIGSIKLIPHSRSLLPFLLSGLSCLLACLALSLIVAVRLSRRMETDITAPLRHLAETAHRVRRDRSFELRVPPANIAELNQINDDFNALLDELEAWQSGAPAPHSPLTARSNTMPFLFKQFRLGFLAMLMLGLLAACQSTPAKKSPFNAEQVATLTEQGFVQTDEGWELSFTDKLLFDFAASSLTAPSRVAIQKISAALLKVGITHMRVEGHTDNEGAEALNIKLSLARANVVADAMGVDWA
eukprot:gene7001-8132_t